MDNTHNFYFLKRKLSRPNTSRSLSSTRTHQQLSLVITAQKIKPLSRISKAVDTGTSPMITDQALQFTPQRKKIVVMRNLKDVDESPSVMIPDEIVKQYIKIPESISFKQKCPLSFLSIPLPPSSFRRRVPEGASLTSRSLIKSLKKEAALRKTTQNPARLFDYNEIVSISHANIRLK